MTQDKTYREVFGKTLRIMLQHVLPACLKYVQTCITDNVLELLEDMSSKDISC